jgi:hypothetical protein
VFGVGDLKDATLCVIEQKDLAIDRRRCFCHFVLSVETSPLETKTTKRPLADMSPIAVVKSELGFDVIWTAKASGVALGVWAETEACAPPDEHKH